MTFEHAVIVWIFSWFFYHCKILSFELLKVHFKGEHKNMRDMTVFDLIGKSQWQAFPGRLDRACSSDTQCNEVRIWIQWFGFKLWGHPSQNHTRWNYRIELAAWPAKHLVQFSSHYSHMRSIRGDALKSCYCLMFPTTKWERLFTCWLKIRRL